MLASSPQVVSPGLEFAPLEIVDCHANVEFLHLVQAL
jgi:hypothetical protein